MTKPFQAILGSALAVLACLIAYILVTHRILWFLKGETVLSGGKEIPTQQFIDWLSPMILYAIPLFLIVGAINYSVLKSKS